MLFFDVIGMLVEFFDQHQSLAVWMKLVVEERC